MVKQRMSSADVAAEVVCLKQTLLGMRMANVYDLSPKTYVLKLAKSAGGESEKHLLLMESGSRFHTTQIMRDKSDVPSNFTLKLRKHIRTKRLEDVRQLGVDRIVDFVFGSGEAQYHLILEMYAQGNIVLCDYKYEVLTLLRSHRDDARGFAVMARHPYPMDAVRLRQAARLDELRDAFDAAEPGATIKSVLANVIPYGPAFAEHCILDAGLVPGTKVVKRPDANSAATTAIAAAAGPATGAAAAPEALAAAAKAAAAPDGVDDSDAFDASPTAVAIATPSKAAKSDPDGHAGSALPADQLSALHSALTRLEDWFTGLDTAVPKGFITLEPPKAAQQTKAAGGAAAAGAGAGKGKKQTKKQQQAQAQAQQQQQQDVAASASSAVPTGATPSAPSAALVDDAAGPSNAAGPVGSVDASTAEGTAGDGKGVVYQDFNPLLLLQSRDMHNLEFPTFDAALDEFYSKIEGQRAEQAQAEAEAQALGKLGRIREDNNARADALAREAAEEDAKAQLIEVNREVVDAAINAINEALATGMDWRELERMIKDERKAGNPVAACIASLQLEANSATVLLSNVLDEEDEGDEAANTRRATRVVVDLGLNAYGNARAHFESRKRHAAKQAKTLAANEQALKAAEKKAQAHLLKVRSTPSALAPARKQNWFEKFHWFISSENYLVISGRDAQQNELIVKRYFRRGDAYVHAELHGASSTIVKNPTPEKPIPPMTLQQAGCACVCRSRAWDSKIITSAWWVQHNQVSKAAPTGEYLPTGSFMIRGRKSFLPPQPLVFGFGFMFKLDDSSVAAHLGERAVRGGDGSDSLTASASLASWPEEQAAEQDVEVPEASSSSDEEQAPPNDGAEGAGDAAAARSASDAASSSQVSAYDRFMESSADISSYSRYGLTMDTPTEQTTTDAADGDGAAAASGTGRTGGTTSGKRRLSAKERQLLKKGLLPSDGRVGQIGGTSAGGTQINASPGAVPSPPGGGELEEGDEGEAEGGEERDSEDDRSGPAAGAAAVHGGGGGRPQGTGHRAAGPAAGAAAVQGGGRGRPPGTGTSSRPHLAYEAGGDQAARGKPQQQQRAAAAAAAAAATAAAASTSAAGGKEGAQRGKNLQAKKLRNKYADQDEEDRKMALEILGSQGEKKTKADRRKERKGKRESKRQAGITSGPNALMGAEAMQEAVSRAMRKDFVRQPQDDGAASESSEELAAGDEDDDSSDEEAGRARARAAPAAGGAGPVSSVPTASAASPAAMPAGGELRGHDDDETVIVSVDPSGGGGGGGEAGGTVANPQRAQRRAAAAAANQAERAEIAALMAEENVMELGDEERERLSILDMLTGCPKPDDVLMFALPVCGPYQIMQNWKFKVKLTPGSVKKGKAARQITELLSRGSDVSARERELLKACPDNDSATAMVGTVKISMPGLQKLKASEKQGRRTAARAAMAAAAPAKALAAISEAVPS